MCSARWIAIVLAVLVATAGCSGLKNNVFKSADQASKAAPDKETFQRELSLARLSERHERPEVAEKIYHGVLTKEPANQVALHRLAVAAARRGQLDRAMEHFQKALTVGPPTAELLSDLGYTHYLTSDLAGAESHLRAAINVDPYHKKAVNNLGLVLGKQRRFEESFAAFSKVVSRAEAHANLAYCQSQLGEFQMAEQNYHRALELDSSHQAAAEALVQLAAHMQKLNRHQAQLAHAQNPANGSPANGSVAMAQHQTPVQQQPNAAAAPVFRQPVGAAAQLPPARIQQAQAAPIAPMTQQAPAGAPQPFAAGQQPLTAPKQAELNPPQLWTAPQPTAAISGSAYSPRPEATPIREAAPLPRNGSTKPPAMDDLDQLAYPQRLPPVAQRYVDGAATP